MSEYKETPAGPAYPEGAVIVSRCCPTCDALAARLAEREAEIAKNGRHAMRVTIAQLEARLANAERDAARYRWLRDPHNSVAEVIDKVVGCDGAAEGIQAEVGLRYEYRAGDELDAAIDAAMATDSADAVQRCPECGMADSFDGMWHKPDCPGKP